MNIYRWRKDGKLYLIYYGRYTGYQEEPYLWKGKTRKMSDLKQFELVGVR